MRGLYIHIPFCERKCIYCDFYSIERTEQIDAFVNALLSEIRLVAESVGNDPAFTSVFFGGGTPSLLKPEQFEEIVSALRSSFNIRTDAEFTLETNPGTITVETLRSYRKTGANRISIGIQSFQEDELSFLGRIHNAKQAGAAVRYAREAGFDNINIDLIYSLPGQTEQTLRYSLGRALDLSPDHISAYSLTFEPETPLYRMLQSKQIQPLPEEEDAALFELTVDVLGSAGYEQYEVSNYARTGRRCRHNLTYWSHDEYVGFGPSAHSYVNGRRYWNLRSLTRYLEELKIHRLPVAGEEILTGEQIAGETIFLGLRADGLDLRKLRSEFGVDLSVSRARQIEEFLRENMIMLNNDRLRVTRKGRIYADLIARELM
jgi:oxygen-independent coproporphyrinogen III oxidase